MDTVALVFWKRNKALLGTVTRVEHQPDSQYEVILTLYGSTGKQLVIPTDQETARAIEQEACPGMPNGM